MTQDDHNAIEQPLPLNILTVYYGGCALVMVSGGISGCYHTDLVVTHWSPFRDQTLAQHVQPFMTTKHYVKKF